MAAAGHLHGGRAVARPVQVAVSCRPEQLVQRTLEQEVAKQAAVTQKQHSEWPERFVTLIRVEILTPAAVTQWRWEGSILTGRCRHRQCHGRPYQKSWRNRFSREILSCITSPLLICRVTHGCFMGDLHVLSQPMKDSPLQNCHQTQIPRSVCSGTLHMPQRTPQRRGPTALLHVISK